MHQATAMTREVRGDSSAGRNEVRPRLVGVSQTLRTADEVAERLQVPKTWVYRAAREGYLPSVRCGRYRRFDDRDVERWIEQQRRSTRVAAIQGS